VIYIYNSNNKFKNQIEYVFMNIFFILGLDYKNIENSENHSFSEKDVLLLYADNVISEQYLNNLKNIIIIKPSEAIYGKNYMKEVSIPKYSKSYKIRNKENISKDIISIFNNNTKLYIRQYIQNRKIIITNIDIVSDIFFMLTRYEEVINTEVYNNEKFNRFPASKSLAFKNNFLNRPIVNEHIDLIWRWIDSFNLDYTRKKWWGDKEFAACLTHDVDIIQKHKKFRNILRSSANLIFKQRKPLKAIINFANYFKGYKKDPYYTFDYMINLEKAYGYRSSFYFMSGGNSEVDNYYDINDKKIINLIKEVENEGCEAGYHCSFNSYNKFEMLKDEKEKINNIVNSKVFGCRQHYLRFKAPYTWRIQEKAGLLYDTTLSYADAEGFRCGTCFPFRPYDLLENRILDLWEIPLIVMDGSLQNPDYRGYTTEQGLEETKKLIDTIKKHNGVFTMLYHNSSFDSDEPIWEGWKETYECTMKYLYDNNCLGTSGKGIMNEITK
jgi:hypothetical protein